MEHIVMADNGRLVIPAPLRQQLGMAKGGKLVASIRDGALVLETYQHAMARVRIIARSYLTPDDSVVDELLAERRDEATKEDAS